MDRQGRSAPLRLQLKGPVRDDPRGDRVAPCCRDPHPRDFHLARARDHALGGRGRETGVNKLHHVTDRKSMRVQDAFGAAIIAGREQFKRTDAVGLDVTPVASVGIVRCLPGSHRLTGYRGTLFQCMEPNLAMALAPACVSVGPLSLTMIRAAPTYQRPHETVGRDQATPFSI